MSKKRIFNLVQLILHMLMLISMVSLPYVEVCVNKTFAWAIDEVVQLGSYTFLGYMQECPYIFATVFVCLIALSAIMCFASTFSKSPKKDGVVHIVLAIIIFLMGFLFYVEPHYVTGYDAIPFGTTKTISLILLAAIAILSVMKRSNIAFPTSEAPITVVAGKTSNADELQKYKELLDSGAISEEEYNAKKKQLLGL